MSDLTDCLAAGIAALHESNAKTVTYTPASGSPRSITASVVSRDGGQMKEAGALRDFRRLRVSVNRDATDGVPTITTGVDRFTIDGDEYVVTGVLGESEEHAILECEMQPRASARQTGRFRDGFVGGR